MTGPVICIGATLVDELFFCTDKTIPATSNPAILKRYAGGVVRNIAHHLAMLDIPVQLLSVLGNDAEGEWILDDCRKNNIGIDSIIRVNDHTGKYASILNADGTLFAAACTDPCTKYLTPDLLQQQSAVLAKVGMIIADTNLADDTLGWIISFCRNNSILLLVEPVSVAKAMKLKDIELSGVFMLTPNEDELPSLCNQVHQSMDEAIDELLARGVKNIWLRKGGKGSVIYNRDENLSLHVPEIKVSDSTGAGDAALAGWAAAYCYGSEPLKCLQAGHVLAMEVLQVPGAVIPGVTREKLFKLIKKYYPDAK